MPIFSEASRSLRNRVSGQDVVLEGHIERFLRRCGNHARDISKPTPKQYQLRQLLAFASGRDDVIRKFEHALEMLKTRMKPPAEKLGPAIEER